MVSIVLLGPPGSGKGTQAEKLVQRYRFVPIALGVLLRKQITENAPDKALIEQYINHGQLVPDSLSSKFVVDLVQEQVSQPLLFDGFPRTLAQAVFLDELLLTHHRKVDGVILLDVPPDCLLERLKNRAVVEGRVDDQEDGKIKTRMDIYARETFPMVSYYKKQGKLYTVDGLQSTSQVEESIVNIVNALNA